MYYIVAIIKTGTIGQEEIDFSLKLKRKLRDSPKYTEEVAGLHANGEGERVFTLKS